MPPPPPCCVSAGRCATAAHRRTRSDFPAPFRHRHPHQPLRQMHHGTHAKIYDTRKTIPGMCVDKYAVLRGRRFQSPHRPVDGLLVKDNHIANTVRRPAHCLSSTHRQPLAIRRPHPPHRNRSRFPRGKPMDGPQVEGVNVILLDNTTAQDADGRGDARPPQRVRLNWSHQAE